MRDSNQHAAITGPVIFPHVPPCARSYHLRFARRAQIPVARTWSDCSLSGIGILPKRWEMHPVTTRVNNLAHDTPECIA